MKRIPILIICTLSILQSENLSAQSLVRDTLFVDLFVHLSNSTAQDIRFDHVTDKRPDMPSTVIGISEKTKFGFVPVDLKLVTHQPVADLIQNAFPLRSEVEPSELSLTLHRLDFSTRKRLFFWTEHIINAWISIQPADSETETHLVFETIHSRFFGKTAVTDGYPAVYSQWLAELAANASSLKSEEIPENLFYPEKGQRWLRLNGGLAATLTQDGYLLDGSLFFDHPEAASRFIRPVGGIRYRNDNGFDAIEWALINDAWQMRFHPKWIFQFNGQLFLGVNRWTDSTVKRRKLYDAVIGDLSVREQICFHPKNKTALTFGAGLHQGCTFIYSRGPRFQYGLLISLGFQR